MADANNILALLEARRNVLLAGPPGTGKSMLLSEVASLFEAKGNASTPTYQPNAPVPIPPTPTSTLPGSIGKATNRKVFRCVLHQSSKYRDFLTGMMPDVRSGKAPGSFRITEGILYKASEYAKQKDSAALLIIDEINRGPTVQVFGGAIVAIEADKRLAADGKTTPATQFFDIINPVDGDLIEYAFPPTLYILGAMNQADVSVEPLDVAFLRRWAPVNLEPSSSVLRAHFGAASSPVSTLPPTPGSAGDVIEAAIQAFDAVNTRIALGRGPEFRIGHGVLMGNSAKLSSVSEALQHFQAAWGTIKNHIDESFFGDVRGTAIILNADRGIAGNPYVLEETSFGDAPRAMINGPLSVEASKLYDLFVSLSQKAV
ncbi:AAA family ATPase [Thalassobacter sp. 16PALIMAR09]|uniref:AAA family ATPase n=1 Tax=Thalassobacter sp. 16PALIMAR09 TaxID=1225651 RepID=UPI00051CDB3C|nr:AAA family ATPase [Thalassobacter sp. 16PALIMAR09]KGL00076.1 ATPase [Thalassobacter sp. 16PALIMAR09]